MRPITSTELEQILETEKYRESRERYVLRMREEGFQIQTPEENELLLDIDNIEAFDFFEIAFKRLNVEFDNCIIALIRPSKSGLPNRHILIRMPFVLTSIDRIAFQAVLGSDLTREMLSIFRLYNTDPCPSLLAIDETKGEWVKYKTDNI